MKRYGMISAFLVFVCCALSDSVATAQTPEDVKENYPIFGAGFEFRFFFPGFQGSSVEGVSGLPDNVRNVPIHKDDGGERRNPILFPNQKLGLINADPLWHGFSLITYDFMPVLKIWRFKPKFGANLTRQFYEEVPYAPGTVELSKVFPEITYQGTLRNQGAALVYVAARVPQQNSFGMVKELEFEITKYHALIVGSKTRHYKIDFETGWDRYAKLEVYKTYNLGQMNIRQVYVGYSYMPIPEEADIGFHFIGGRNLNTFKPESIPSSLQAVSNGNFFLIGLSARIRSW